MKNFGHVNAATLDEAVSALRRYGKRAAVIAGGTDLLGKMKDEVLPTYPEALINIKTVPGLDFITYDGGTLSIGALTRLEDIATNDAVRHGHAALAEAARRTASTHLREMGTIGGNICQDIRCWYYRNPQNRFPCLRKGGGGAMPSMGTIAITPSSEAVWKKGATRSIRAIRPLPSLPLTRAS